MALPARHRLVRRMFDIGERLAAASLKDPPSFSREVDPGSFAHEQNPVTAAVYARLSDEDIAEVEAAVRDRPELAAILDATTEDVHRRRVILSYGLWLRVPAVLSKTRLDPHEPPEDVHTMSRGPLSAAGGLYEADMLIDALRSAGMEPESVRHGLDFGCSSGRVVRVLAAEYPEAQWLGCDPNQGAIEWARENLPCANFFLSASRPPLELADASIDFAYAISIWSHFSPRAGLEWFNEMFRVVQPKGILVLTTHGLQSVAYFAGQGLRSPEVLDEIRLELYRRGYWYAAEFGEKGDAGIIDPDWGTSFLAPEWVLTHLCPTWRLLEYAPGRNQTNQDVYVLQRV